MLTRWLIASTPATSSAGLKLQCPKLATNACRSRLPSPAARDLAGVEVLLLHRDELVADGVQVEFRDRQVPGRDRGPLQRPDRGRVGRDVGVPRQRVQVARAG